MLSLTGIFKSQARYGISATMSSNEYITYEMYLTGCRRMLIDKTPRDYFSWERRKQNDFTDNLIIAYVRNNVKDVDGFLDDNGDIMTDRLIDRLRTDIVDFGILREALDDDEVQEIQINDYKTIWVIKGGKAYLYVDNLGKPYQFVSDEELHSTIDRMIYSSSGSVPPRMTLAQPLLNARTAQKGYRLSGVNSTAVTSDSNPCFDFPVTTVTIRKFAPSMLTFEDFEEKDTMTSEMSYFLKLCGRSDVKLICVGPTSSGKTTLLNALAWEIPKDNRIILIQNPTEIMLYERSPETGTNLRNVLHWEASDIDIKLQDDPRTPSMAHEIEHALRNTPDVIIPGEVRTPTEMKQMSRAAQTGQRVLSSLHAYDGSDAVSRASGELATLGGSARDHALSLVASLDIAVTQRKLADGSRKVISIEEYTGNIKSDGSAETITIFRFHYTGKVKKGKNGTIEKIEGYYEQVNTISEKLVTKFYSAGISIDEIEPLLTCPEILDGRSNLPSQQGGK